MMLNRKARRGLKARGIKLARKAEDIRNEYMQVCAQAGDIQYKLVQLGKALNDANNKLEALNKEFETLPKEEPKKEETANVVTATPEASANG